MFQCLLWINDKFKLQINPPWHEKGIMVVGDLINEFFNILPPNTINETYGIDMNFLDHRSLRHEVNEFLEFRDKPLTRERFHKT